MTPETRSQDASREAFTRDDADVRIVKEEPTILDDVIDETEAGLSLNDFEPAKIESRASFDMATQAGQLMWIEAQNARHNDLVGRGEFIATVTDWVCWRKDVVRPNGEVEANAWVCCLWTKEHGRISFASLLTVKQWANIARALKTERITLPRQFAFVPVPSKIKGGNPWYSILPVLEDNTA